MSAAITISPDAAESPPVGVASPASPASLASEQARPWRSDSIELAAQPGTVSAARARTRAMLRAWGLDELAEDAEHIVAELAANAVAATRKADPGAPVWLTLTAGLRTLLIAVRDTVPDPPVMRDPDPDALSGRGLVIVDALAASWAWKPHRDGGKVVRALLRGPRHA